jgi:hypothetical protein
MPETNQSLARQQRREIYLRISRRAGAASPRQNGAVDRRRRAHSRKAEVSDSGFFLFSVCAMGLYGYMKTPAFEGVARLRIDPMRSSGLGLDEP